MSTELGVEKFLKRLAGRTDLDDALKRLDRLTQEEARMAVAEVLRITQSVREEVKVVEGKVESTGEKLEDTANVVDEIKCSCSSDHTLHHLSFLTLKLLTVNQLVQLLRAWLSPSDPSTNHNIARKAQYKGTAVWLFQGSIFIEWKSTGSLLWIHGKRAFLSESVFSARVF